MTTLVIGSKAAVIIDPPFSVPDAEAVVEMIKSKAEGFDVGFSGGNIVRVRADFGKRVIFIFSFSRPVIY